jgi:hypothetical protein
MKSFTSETVEIVSKEITAALNTIADSHGIDLSFNSIRYSADEISLRVSGVILTDGKSREQLEFEKYASRFGLRPSDYGTSFHLEGKRMTLCGIAPKSTKYPILARSGEATYKLPAELIHDVLLGEK